MGKSCDAGEDVWGIRQGTGCRGAERWGPAWWGRGREDLIRAWIGRVPGTLSGGGHNEAVSLGNGSSSCHSGLLPHHILLLVKRRSGVPPLEYSAVAKLCAGEAESGTYSTK